MKPTTIRTGRTVLFFASLILTVGLVSWDHRDTARHFQQTFSDTIPKKKTIESDKKVRDLDDVLDELDRADLEVNMQKVRQQMEESMKNLDVSKLKLQMEQAMKAVDMEKMKKEMEEAFSKIDMEKVKKEISEAMKQVDAEKIQQDIRESMAKVDWEKMKEEMNKVKEIDMKKVEAELEKAKIELKDIGPRIDKEMARAKEDIEKAKTEIREYKSFVDGLEKDGLINKKEGYSLKHKDGELFINGKKVSDQTYNKYRSFLEKHSRFNIEKSDNDFDFNKD